MSIVAIWATFKAVCQVLWTMIIGFVGLYGRVYVLDLIGQIPNDTAKGVMTTLFNEVWPLIQPVIMLKGWKLAVKLAAVLALPVWVKYIVYLPYLIYSISFLQKTGLAEAAMNQVK